MRPPTAVQAVTDPSALLVVSVRGKTFTVSQGELERVVRDGRASVDAAGVLDVAPERVALWERAIARCGFASPATVRAI